MDSVHVAVKHFLPYLAIVIVKAYLFYIITVLVFHCFFVQESKQHRIVVARHHSFITVYGDIKVIEGYGWIEEIDSQGSEW